MASAISGEQKLFESRRQGRLGQRALLQERIAQIVEEVRGLSSTRKAKEGEISLITEELKGVAELYAKNLVSIMRYMALQRDKTKIEGEHGQLGAEIARARGRTSEIELQILQLEKDFVTEVLKELRDIDGRVAELKERMIAAVDQLRRIDIRSPGNGTVLQLTVHTVGGVDWRRRDHHADRAASRPARGRSARGSGRYRPDRHGCAGAGAHPWPATSAPPRR